MRGQANVVGIAILLGITVIALGALTASIGTVIDAHAANADAARVADGIGGALDPVETTGRNRGRVTFTDGSLRTVERDLRVLDAGGVRHVVGVDALVFQSDEHRVAFAAGAIVRGTGRGADLLEPPPFIASVSGSERGRRSGSGSGPTYGSGSEGVLVVGAPRLGGQAAVGGSGGVAVMLRTDVRHDRTNLGQARFAVAVETTTPGAWEEFFGRQNATVSRRDFDADGIVSVVGTYPGQRQGYLVVHDMNLEVDP